ncbi:MAG TPA: hypothetical protein VF469_07495 [Kofleriaceae bacterium]
MTDESVRDAEPGAEPSAEPGAEIDEVILGAVSDYLDGALTDPERAEIAGKIASDAAWTRAHAELTETRKFLSGLQKAHAPPRFAEEVAETIHQRSAGRFFARKTLGDRVPFGAVLAVALAGLLVIGYVLWSSSTGSLKVDHGSSRTPDAGSAPVAPP